MSSKFTSSLPAQPTHDSSGEKTSAVSSVSSVGSIPVPDLSTLRKGWSNKVQSIPLIPDATSVVGTGSDKKRLEQNHLPDLPAMGAMASKATLAMEAHAELLEEKQPHSIGPIAATPIADTPPPSSDGIDQNILSSEPSIFDLGNDQKPTLGQPIKPSLDIPRIPEIEIYPTETDFAALNPETPLAEEAEEAEELSAMPTMAAPELSIPLVRDQFITAEEPVNQPARTEKSVATPAPRASSAAPTEEPEKPAKQKRSRPPEQSESATPEAASQKTPEYTDQDFHEALRPFIEPTVDKFLYTPTQGIHTYLEPMLRSTVRRAIAEQMEDASPFREVSGWDKLAWKMRALIGSRTYEDIVFNHTKRYQVEEIYLLRPQTRSLISYASHDPSRHAKPKKVEITVKKIAAKTAEKDQENEGLIKWENNRNLMIRKGTHCILAAIVHGSSNAILRSDLDYALRQAEERFGKTLEDESDIHLQILQPLLEGCLLIQSPAIPN